MGGRDESDFEGRRRQVDATVEHRVIKLIELLDIASRCFSKIGGGTCIGEEQAKHTAGLISGKRYAMPIGSQLYSG